MVDSSLTYEILMYLNHFYFGMFATCELGEEFWKGTHFRLKLLKLWFFLGMEALKFVNLSYENEVLYRELIIVLALLTLESVRIYLGKQGSLSDHGKIL